MSTTKTEGNMRARARELAERLDGIESVAVRASYVHDALRAEQKLALSKLRAVLCQNDRDYPDVLEIVDQTIADTEPRAHVLRREAPAP